MNMKGATLVQLREYRISITRPPFSDATDGVETIISSSPNFLIIGGGAASL